jgi:hypothetical protein
LRRFVDSGDGIHKPDKNNPQVFMLYRPGVFEPLLTRSDVSREQAGRQLVGKGLTGLDSRLEGWQNRASSSAFLTRG